MESSMYVVCPYCGYVDRDSWEIDFGPGTDGSAEIECGCGNTFTAHREVNVTYSTTMDSKNTNRPKYVRLGKGGVALIKETDGYYRPAGHWSVKDIFIEGVHQCSKNQIYEMKHVVGLELIPCSEEEFKEDNAGYV